jgi:hypothetical protein
MFVEKKWQITGPGDKTPYLIINKIIIFAADELIQTENTIEMSSQEESNND